MNTVKKEAIAQLSQFKFANMILWSDVLPFEIVRIVSDKCIEVREMKATRDESVNLEFSVGGFAAHCSNQHEQKWIYTSNPENRVQRIRKNKKGGWGIGKTRFSLSDKPFKFHDYNF
jgi:hypothetical protein